MQPPPAQRPRSQVSPAPQALPQRPQLFASTLSALQTLPHKLLPGSHWQREVCVLQTKPAAHGDDAEHVWFAVPVPPAAPVLPVDPVAPVGPVLPVLPVDPVVPVLPLAPVVPGFVGSRQRRLALSHTYGGGHWPSEMQP